MKLSLSYCCIEHTLNTGNLLYCLIDVDAYVDKAFRSESSKKSHQTYQQTNELQKQTNFFQNLPPYYIA